MSQRPEPDKKPGLHYALTRDGLELPIVDVTHPAFALAMTPAEQDRLVRAFLAERPPFSKLPGFLRRLILRRLLAGSTLARGIRNAAGTFLGGMETYLLKLGPDNLGSSYAKPIDRHIAASLPALATRL